jgi:predicted extracellular nuclease
MLTSPQDGNPEAILIADPLDGSDNPLTSKMGDRTADITGIVKPIYISRESNSYYSIVPTTALQVIAPSSAQAPPASLRPGSDCRAVTVGSYNVENLSPASTHLPKVAAHIVDMLGSPDLLFVQEIQDDSGPTDNDGILAADRTLSALAAAVEGHSNGTVRYHFASVEPAAPNTDGGANGANIRQAYLYRPERLELFRPSPGAGADGTEVLEDPLRLRLNPGRIEPGDAAWTKSRKPLAAAWMARGAKNPFFTVNVHWASKTGGASLHANGRTPVNAGAQQRLQQAEVTGVSYLPALPKVSGRLARLDD